MKTFPKPYWLKVKLTPSTLPAKTKQWLDHYNLNTVCEEACCPNLFQCWSNGALTLMILGKVCTRFCRFCATNTGNPGGKLDKNEPQRVANFVHSLEVNYAIITSVARDDLPDGGAEIFAETVDKIKEKTEMVRIELLIPDFGGSSKALETVAQTQPDVVGHNIESVKRLSGMVRDSRASYETSLKALETLKAREPQILTKSSLMLGLGETEQEVVDAMEDLRAVGVDIFTVGQYLSPSDKHLPVLRYVTPEEFEYFRNIGYQIGFKSVLAGPLVRSSYRAHEAWQRALDSS